MKKRIALLIVSLVAGAVAEESGHFVRPTNSSAWDKSVTLLENERMVITRCHEGGMCAFIVDYGEVAVTNVFIYIYNNSFVYPESMRTINGPCTITPMSGSSGGLTIDYKILRSEDSVNTSPINIVALPADNNGDVDLLVESSSDLITWTPIYSGSAGTSGSGAFFRTRLTQN